MAWLSGWKKRIPIQIDYTNKIGGSVTHFPVTIFLKSGNGDTTKVFNEVGSNKYKIVVTKSDGTSQLYVEIEQWDAQNQKAVLHVSKSDWTINADAYVYLYYDNSQSDNTTYVGDVGSSAGQAVWDSYFEAVWHLREASGTTLYDSKNLQNLTKVSATEPNPTIGKVDGAQDFDGSNDYASKSASNALAGKNTLTFEALVKFDSLSGQRDILARSATSGSYAFFYVWNISDLPNRFHMGVYNGSAWGYYNGTQTLSLSTNTWYYVSTTYNNGYITYYKDGQSYDSGQTGGNVSVNTSSGTLYLGRSWNVNYFDGIIDEVRISNVVRSAAWIKGTYNSLFDTLLSYGEEELFSLSTKTSFFSFNQALIPLSKTTASNFNIFNYLSKKLLSAFDIQGLIGAPAKIKAIIKDIKTRFRVKTK